MADYAELIERLEKATGPDRDLDAQIFRDLIGFSPNALPQFWPAVGNQVPRYTSSIDEAQTLVPPAHDWSLHVDNGEAIVGCMPESEDGCDVADSTGATPAIALCIAALKARAVLIGSKGI
jgi:hypothetical protein